MSDKPLPAPAEGTPETDEVFAEWERLLTRLPGDGLAPPTIRDRMSDIERERNTLRSELTAAHHTISEHAITQVRFTEQNRRLAERCAGARAKALEEAARACDDWPLFDGRTIAEKCQRSIRSLISTDPKAEGLQEKI